jgi:hypothetical protein
VERSCKIRPQGRGRLKATHLGVNVFISKLQIPASARSCHSCHRSIPANIATESETLTSRINRKYLAKISAARASLSWIRRRLRFLSIKKDAGPADLAAVATARHIWHIEAISADGVRTESPLVDQIKALLEIELEKISANNFVVGTPQRSFDLPNRNGRKIDCGEITLMGDPYSDNPSAPIVWRIDC